MKTTLDFRKAFQEIGTNYEDMDLVDDKYVVGQLSLNYRADDELYFEIETTEFESKKGNTDWSGSKIKKYMSFKVEHQELDRFVSSLNAIVQSSNKYIK